jgi:hypothetical protein
MRTLPITDMIAALCIFECDQFTCCASDDGHYQTSDTHASIHYDGRDVKKVVDNELSKSTCRHFKVHPPYIDTIDVDLTKCSRESSQEVEHQMLSTDYGRGIFFREVADEYQLTFLRNNTRLYVLLFTQLQDIMDKKFPAAAPHVYTMFPDTDCNYVR